MREYTIKVEEIEVEGKKIQSMKGTVIVQVPNYVERLKLMEQAGLSKMDSKDFGAVIKIVELAQKHAISVDVEADGEKINNFEDLGIFQEGVAVINYIFSILVGGIPLKKI